MSEVNPKCTSFCTGAGDSKGHLPTGQDDIAFMLAQLERAHVKAEPTPAAVATLYRKGHGYHAIADALGISHERAFMILTGQEKAVD